MCIRSRFGVETWTVLAAGFVLASAAVVFADPSDATYRLVFADEFNGTAIDTAKWQVANPGWTMPNSLSTVSANQVSVGSGVMTMNATRTGASTWNSGSISSYQKYNFAGGYVEARIQLPTTPGSWPAFWGLYNGWPPEADIMEYPLTTDGGTNGYTNNAYHTAFHYTNTAGAAASGAGKVTTGQNLSTTGYHTFAMDWTSGTSVRFLLDGNQVTSFSNASVAQMANMYMILDYAVGGWPGTPTTSQWAIGESDQTKVDWVHVWQKNGSGDTTSAWKVAGDGAFTAGGNWANGIAPSYGNQTAVFGRVGSNATATVSTGSWQVLGNLTFDGAAGGTTAYTLGSSASQIQLATTAAGGSVVQATAASTANQNINAKVELWSNTTARNDMAGGQTLNFNSEVSGNGALSVSGVGTVMLNAPGTYTGGTVIGTNQEAAVLRANADNALGTGGVVIGTAGNATTARLELAGGHRLANNIDYRGRTNASAGIVNVSGNNALDGTISANVGGNIFQIRSDSGTLTLTGSTAGSTSPGVALTAISGARNFTLTGAGSGIVSGQIRNGGGTVSLTKDGAGTWSLQGANTYTGTTKITAGTLRATPMAYANLLTNAGGVDLQSAGMVVLDYNGSTTPAAQVKSILDAGYASNFATGQIRATTIAADQTVGYGDSGNGVLKLRLTLPGDADLDGDVDFVDFLILQNNFSTAGTRFDQANFNYDGRTDFNDFLILQNHFGQSIGTASAPAVTLTEYDEVMAITSASTVPEPAALAILGFGSMMALQRRRNARSLLRRAR